MSPKRPSSALDHVLMQETAVRAIQEAERSQPDDVWTNEVMLGHHNLTRSRREYRLAHHLLSEVEPRLREMPLRQLVVTLRTFDGVGCGDIPDGVASDFHCAANGLIMHEIERRPLSELEALPEFYYNNWRDIWLGPQCIGNVANVLRDARQAAKAREASAEETTNTPAASTLQKVEEELTGDRGAEQGGGHVR